MLKLHRVRATVEFVPEERAMQRYLDYSMRYLNHLGTWEWFVVLVAVLVLGLFCMRGFGSRTDY
jgi:hypothetical protein